MAYKIFINYRRDDSIGMAGRLHDRLAQSFGGDNLFMDVDHIPVGVDFVKHLNNQVAACDVLLVVIGPDWLKAKDKSGQRRLYQQDDFVAIEIAAALARDIRVIPVLVEGARMPKESELPDTLKSLARRQAAEVRHAHFGKDADVLIARMRETLGDKSTNSQSWRVRAAVAAAAVAVSVLLLMGWGGYALVQHTLELGAQPTDLEQAEKRKAAESEQQKQQAQSNQELQARAANEAEQKRKDTQTEQRRLAEAQAERERQARAAAEAPKAEQAEHLPPHEDNNQRGSPQPNETHGAWLGVKIQQVTDDIAESLNIKPARGALVASVDDKGPAKPAGIEPGDVIIKFDGKDIKEMRDLPRIVGDTAIGKNVEVIIIRKGREEQRSIQLSALPTKPEASSTSDQATTNQHVAAKSYPTKPITMTVPFPAGGASDVLGRILAQRMGEIIGHEVSVENVAGEGGADGSKLVADARPDGHRFLFGSVSTNALYQVLHTAPRYEAAAFTPVALVAEIPLVLMARPNLQIGNLKEFLTYARTNQNTLQYGSGGNGTLSHLACARFNDLVGINPRHVPSPGIGPALQNLLANRVDYFCETAATAKRMVGKVKFIATMAQERSKALPDVPTAREQSGLDIEITYWSAIFLPNGAPSDIVRKLHDIIVEALNTSAVRDKFETAGAALVSPDRTTPQYLSQFTSSEIRKWGATVKTSGFALR